jgi:Flp pilus assembly protein TadB
LDSNPGPPLSSSRRSRSGAKPRSSAARALLLGLSENSGCGKKVGFMEIYWCLLMFIGVLLVCYWCVIGVLLVFVVVLLVFFRVYCCLNWL